MRDPNSPIPGFEDEFTGTVGHEKRIHNTHFAVPELNLRKTKEDEYEWIRYAPGKYKRVKKEIQ